MQSDRSATNIGSIPASLVKKQIEMALNNYQISAVKIGMLATSAITKVTADALRKLKNIPIIIDPVLESSSGKKLINKKAIEILLNELLPQTYCLTPNLKEAEILSGIKIKQKSDIKKAAEILLNMGAKNVLLKGGHMNDEKADDYLFGEKELVFSDQRFAKNIRGTGCSLASAIACNLAKQLSLEESITNAKKYVSSLFFTSSAGTLPSKQ